MANNFKLVLLSNQSIASGDAESFCAGTGSITLTRTGGRNNGIQIKGSIWDKVATIKWYESDYSLASNIGYYDSARNWTQLSPTLNWNGRNLTITNLNMPSGDLELFVGADTSSDRTYSNLEILDAYGNSLLEAEEPSTGLPLYIGDSNIQAVKLGDVDISKMYIGDTLIYGSDEPTESIYNWSFDATYGNPVNNGGVISGFSSTDVLAINNPVVSTTDFEMLFDIVTGQGSSNQYLIRSESSFIPDFYNAPNTYLYSNGKFCFCCSNSQNPSQYDTILTSNVTYQDNTNYRILITIRNGVATLDIKDNNDILIDTVSAQSSGITWNYNTYICGAYGESSYFKGVFNSNKSYIKINGNLISNITENT